MRLDKYLVEKGFVETRNRANILLEKGLVLVNDKIQKPSYNVKELDEIKIVEPIKYVSMGGYKLEKAINTFSINLKDKICADVGCSKGGFTQCMLINGAKNVYAIDVSISELDESLIKNNKVITKEINARELSSKTFSDKMDFIAVDCSFISVKYILNNLLAILSTNGEMVILLKPQFECGANNLTKSGIVKNKKILINLCKEYFLYFSQNGLKVKDFTFAPIRENKNIEFLFYLSIIGETIDIRKIEEILGEL